MIGAGTGPRRGVWQRPAGRRLVCFLVLCTGLLSAPAPEASNLDRKQLDKRLDRLARKAGGASGIAVSDLSSAGTALVYSRRSARRRVLASNTKLFTTAAALDALGGANRRLRTSIHLGGTIQGRRLEGNVFLVGDGDPALNSARFRKAGVPHTGIGPLAGAVKQTGIRKIDGRLIADDTIFDRVRGVPYSNWATTSQIGGPLGGLTYDSARGAADPAIHAAKALRKKLRRIGVKVKRVKVGKLPDRLRARPPIATAHSPRLARLVNWTNRVSDNFFAEMLLKRIWARPGSRKGTTRNGASAAERFAARLGTAVKLADGSGLSSGNRATPAEVVRLLDVIRSRSEFKPFWNSLPKAGQQGTLADRMEGSVAEGRCRAKTGTLSGVATLSGYCKTKSSKRLLAFSILMNKVDVNTARAMQDKMVKAIARYRP